MFVNFHVGKLGPLQVDMLDFTIVVWYFYFCYNLGVRLSQQLESDQ